MLSPTDAGRNRPRNLDRRPRRRRMQVEELESRCLLSAGTWTELTNAAPSSNGIGTMMMLPNGTVMCLGGGTPAASNNWFQLTPDSTGSYINGTWSQLASMSLQRLYFASNVLPTGQVFVLGGEYSGPNTTQNFTNKGEIYNIATNSWSSITNFPESQFGDDPTQLMANGNILAGYLAGPQTFIYSPSTNTWTPSGTKLSNDQSDEECWVTMPNGDILSYNVFASTSSNPTAQFFNPSTGTWTATGKLPAELSSGGVGDELGPAFALQNGNIFQIGGNSNTAVYNPTTNTWTAGPTIASGRAADDAPGAALPNGNILFAVDTPLFVGPTKLQMYNPAKNTLINVTVPSTLNTQLNHAAFINRMEVLPTGQVLLTTGSDNLWIFTPSGQAKAAEQPVVQSIVNNNDGTFTLSGTGLNGVSSGSAYGDDAEMDTNFPIVKLVSTSTGQVFYATTSNWSLPGQVQTGSTVETVKFTLPTGLPSGTYNLFDIGAGISSAAFSFTAPGVGHVPSNATSGLTNGSGQTSTDAQTVVHTPSLLTAAPLEATHGIQGTGAGSALTHAVHKSLLQGGSGSSAGSLSSTLFGLQF
jgi:hypothetical protein